MHTPNYCVLRLQILTQHSQMSPLQGVLRLFCDSCHTIGAIQVAADRVLDQARRLVECMFVLKTGLFNLRYQVNWVHMKGFLILFHMRYSSLLSDKKWAGDN